MATVIKATPTLEGKEAEEFLRKAEEAEKNYVIDTRLLYFDLLQMRQRQKH